MRSTKTLKQLGYSGLGSFIGVVAAILIGQFYILNFTKERSGLIDQEKIFIILISGLVGALFFGLLFPKYRQLFKSYEQLIASEDSAKSMASQVSKLYDELGKSYQDLEATRHHRQELSILMKMDVNGELSHISEKFKDIMFMEASHCPSNFYNWLKSQSFNGEFINQLQDITQNKKSWNGEIKVFNEEGDLTWLDLVIQPVPANKTKDDYNLLVIGRDVTEITEAKQMSREINHELVDKRVKEQQYRSVLILEGQEEERKRLAQEMHDGIGQMLTGLKLNLEGLVLNEAPHMRQRLSDAKHLMKSVIREVRRVSFNLAPSSLVDFGIVPALKKISQETTALTNTKVTFTNESGFINRLDSNTETNLYRIVQEAINNGIKYAKAKEITIKLSHNINQLTIKVSDNGKGFDIKKLENAGHFGSSGHGIYNMKERAAYVNAAFEIDTEVGKGTTITIKLPLT